MALTADGLGTAFDIALMLVAIMLIHYLLWQASASIRCAWPPCLPSNLASSSPCAVQAPGAELLWDAATGVVLFAIAVIAWQLGLRRVRNAG